CSTTAAICTLALHDALPIYLTLRRLLPRQEDGGRGRLRPPDALGMVVRDLGASPRLGEHLFERIERIRDRAHAHCGAVSPAVVGDRKSTRLNSSHGSISYAV